MIFLVCDWQLGSSLWVCFSSSNELTNSIVSVEDNKLKRHWDARAKFTFPSHPTMYVVGRLPGSKPVSSGWCQIEYEPDISYDSSYGVMLCALLVCLNQLAQCIPKATKPKKILTRQNSDLCPLRIDVWIVLCLVFVLCYCERMVNRRARSQQKYANDGGNNATQCKIDQRPITYVKANDQYPHWAPCLARRL